MSWTVEERKELSNPQAGVFGTIMGSVRKVYLYGSEFVVLADNNSLTYVLTSAKLDATGHRWLATFSTYNFSIKCLANKDADGLSR